MGHPWPYSFRLRPLGTATGTATALGAEELGFVCPNIRPFTWTLYGAIPGKLAAGDSVIADGSNVIHANFDNMHSGGLGARLGTDTTRYMYASGVYAGDIGEWYLQPKETEITVEAGHVSLTGKVIKQILPWVTPTTLGSAGLGAAPAAPTFTYQESDSGLTAGQQWAFALVVVTASGKSPIGTPAVATVPATADDIRIAWTAVSGATAYELYGHKGAAWDATKARLVKKATPNTFQIFKRPSEISDTITPPTTSVTAANNTNTLRRVLVIACDATTTWLYTMDITGATPKLRDLKLRLDSDAATVALTASLTGTVIAGGATVWQNQVILPLANAAGTQTWVRVWYDASKPDGTVPGEFDSRTRYKVMANTIGDRAVPDGTRRLWRTHRHLAFHCADPFAATPSWTGPILVGDAGLNINGVRIYGGTAGDAATYFAKGDGLFRILETEDGPNTFAEMVTPLGVSDSENGRVFLEHAGQLIISGRYDLFRHTIGSLDSADPNKDEGLPPSLRGIIKAAATTGRHLYVLTGEPAGIGGTDYANQTAQQIIETKQGEVWHQVYMGVDGYNRSLVPEILTAAQAGVRWQGDCIEVVGPDLTQQQLTYLVFTGGTGGNRLFRIPVRSGRERLREATDYAPCYSGTITLPPYAHTERAKDKTWMWATINQVWETAPHMARLTTEYRVYHTGLPRDEWITIGDWTGGTSVNGGSVYDPLGVTEQHISNDTVGAVRAGAIQVRATIGLNPLHLTAQTPVFENIGLALLETSLPLRRWVFNVNLAQHHKLVNGTKVQADDDDLWEILKDLQDMAALGGPAILQVPEGTTSEEAIVRVDLAPISPRWDTRVQKGTTMPKTFPRETTIQIVCTEIAVMRSRVATTT